MSDHVVRGSLCPHCNRYNSRHIVTNGIVVKDNKILLIKRGIEPGYGKWALPGGYLDWDETAEEGVLREVFEETGVKAKIEKMLEVRSSPERNMQNVGLMFLLSADDEKLVLQKEEILDGGWFAQDNLPSPIAFDHNILVEKFFNGDK